MGDVMAGLKSFVVKFMIRMSRVSLENLIIRTLYVRIFELCIILQGCQH